MLYVRKALMGRRLVKIFNRSKNVIIVLVLLFLIFTESIVKANEGPKVSPNNNFSNTQTNNHTATIHGKVVKIYLQTAQKDKNTRR